MQHSHIPKTLGHYIIGRKIGEGGMGEVYQGEDTRLLRRVAIKIIPVSSSYSTSENQSLLNEARMASAINHPNICTIYDVGEYEAYFYIVMEYIAGHTLAQELNRRGALPEQEVVAISLQVCEALAAAHEQGIIHRDIKPDNIMLCENGLVKIMDFGLARLLNAPSVALAQTRIPGSDPRERLTSGGLEGTVLYMAPEQIDRGELTPSSDVYALGAVLYELLTGVPPFQGDDSVDLVTAILEKQPLALETLRAGLHSGLCDVVHRALAKEPAERFADAQEFAAALACCRHADAQWRILLSNPWFISLLLFIPALILLVLLLLRPADVRITNLRELHPADRPLGNLILSPDGDRVAYLIDEGEEGAKRSKLVIQDLQTGQLQRIGFEPATGELNGPYDWSPDGRQLLMTGKAGGLLAIDTTGRVVQYFSDFGFEPRWSPDGQRIAFSRFESPKFTQTNEVWIYELKQKKVYRLSPQDGDSYHSPAWSPDGRWLVCVGGVGSNRYLALQDREGKTLHKLFESSQDISQPAWLASGNTIYFTLSSSEIWRLPVEMERGIVTGPPERAVVYSGITISQFSRRSNRLLFMQRSLVEAFWEFPFPPESENPWSQARLITRPQNWGITNLDLSPDGRQAVFETTREGSRALSLVDLKRVSQRLIYNEQDAFGPSFSADGDWIAFDAGGGNQADIWMVSVADGQVKKLIDSPGADWMPRYSPDGSKLSFVSNRDGRFDIWLLYLDDGSVRKVTDTPEMESAGYWSRDGSRLAFFRNSASDNHSAVWVVDLDSGREQKVFDMPEPAIDLTTAIAWGSGDSTLVFADGFGLRFLNLHTRQSTRPLDDPHRPTNDIRYAIHEQRLYLLQRTFLAHIFLADIRE